MGTTRGDPDPGADLDALPAELVDRSLSKTSLILPLDAALQVIALRAGQGRRLENWEGWVRMPDGGRAKSLSHGGSFALPRDVAAAAERATAGMRRAQERWDREPEYERATLFFGLTFAKPDAG